ncbi:leucine-rich repeat and fibronectin type-III domain-containing protein 5-like [Mizuhopecten yessoensis]|uniref:leucine-rich repeat and fibronectin type-III domain-containing protein 5-like n=1 Tax=Mizuhopecten yessoensis TaxID=6573 RepID=UPI000B457FD9|nr:leucine-rich repeat and fibronectin type-III domain-containing protein 5-like [Mizuhopecten yessoensis]
MGVTRRRLFNDVQQVVLLFLVLLIQEVVQAAYLAADLHTEKLGKSVLTNSCPTFCQCDTNSNTNCTLEYGVTSLDDVNFQKLLLSDLTLTGNYSCIPKEFQGQLSIQTLKFTNSFLVSLFCKSWVDLPNVVDMDLSQNYISLLQYPHFSSSVKLRSLNLSRNVICQIDSQTFEKQSLLENLDLSHNQLSTLDDKVFDTLTSLTHLDLSHNYLSHVHDSVFKSLLKLTSLKLDNNKIKVMSFDNVQVLPSIHSVSLSGNNWECSCMLESLLKYVQSRPQKFVNDDPARCLVPESLNNKLLSEVPISDLPCSQPNISQVSHNRNFLVRNDVYLACGTSIFPHAQIYWQNARGQVFAHPTVRLDWKSLNISSVKARREYVWPVECTDKNTVVRAEIDGSLYFDNIHGSFAGDYTCFAVNKGGQTNVTINVMVISSIRPVFYEGLIYGAASSGLMLVIAIFVGIMKTCRSCCKKLTCSCHCYCCCCCRNPQNELKKGMDSEENISAASSILDDCEYTSSHYKSDDDYDDSKSPLSWGQSSRSSPQKCVTPTVESKERWQNISGTLDEVKIQLERRMEKVRCHVHSMRESGSQYIMTIKDTGSQAATRVKAGMVLGVEQVKSGVMSMKEFCGTGEMGTQTISVISVSTDIDTQKQTEVVKSIKITYV